LDEHLEGLEVLEVLEDQEALVGLATLMGDQIPQGGYLPLISFPSNPQET